ILGTKTFAMLFSDTAVKDLIDKRSGIYSTRPVMCMAQDVASGGARTVLMKNGPLWRKYYKLINDMLNIRASVSYVPYQDLENKQMLVGLLESPEKFHHHIRCHTKFLATQMIFGFRTQHIDYPKDRIAYRSEIGIWSLRCSASGAASQVLGFLPVLRKLPTFLRLDHCHAQELHGKERVLHFGHRIPSLEAYGKLNMLDQRDQPP
ncbi:hypothetical protein BJ878DRAFT_421967, partial [Calycina marina]